MERRRFVVLLGALAGCNALGSSEQNVGQSTATATRTSTPASPTSTQTATASRTAEPAAETEQPTSTETEPDASTQTSTPTARAEWNAELRSAARALTQVVGQFTEGFGSELTDVTASSTEFSNQTYDIERAMARAQKKYIDAIDAAETDAQQVAAERMRACWQFLRHATRTQSTVVDGYEHLVNARTAFEEVDPESARGEVEDLRIVHQTATTQYEDLLDAATVEAATVIEAISAEEYDAKRAQFDADIGIYRDLEPVLREFTEGTKWLELAQAEDAKTQKDFSDLEDYATNARRTIAGVRNTLSEMKGNLGDDATLRPAVESLRAVAAEKVRVADSLRD